VCSGTVAKGGKMFNKAAVGQDAGLREAIHAFANLNHDKVIVDKWFEVVLFHDAVGNGRQGNMHVFQPFRGGVEIEAGNVDGHEPGICCGDDAVEEAFGDGDIGGGSADLARVVNSVTDNDEVDAGFFLFLGLTFGDNAEIGGLESFGMAAWETKCMVSVPDFMFGRVPCARWPIFLPAAWIPALLSGPSLSWEYSSEAPVAGLMSELADQQVGRTLSLHYYYLAFVVLTYLAYLIAVNTSYRSSLGTTDPGIQAPCCIRLGYLEKVRKAHFLFLLISRISSHSIVRI
jgi:hypothetical protein